MSNLWYEMAMDALWAPASDWVYRSDRNAKQQMFSAFDSLPEQAQKAYMQEVISSFRRLFGSEAILWRRMKSGQSSSNMGGRSLSAQRVEGVSTAFRVRAKDVFMHYGMSDTPLSSKAFGHELEVILKPSASPTLIHVASTSDEIDMNRADHITIRKILTIVAGGKVRHVREEYDRIARVFSKAGGSWERLFKGNTDDMVLLKRVVKVALKQGHITRIS